MALDASKGRCRFSIRNNCPLIGWSGKKRKIQRQKECA